MIVPIDNDLAGRDVPDRPHFAAGDKVIVSYQDAVGHKLRLEGNVVRPYLGPAPYDWMVDIGYVVMAFAEEDIQRVDGAT